MTDKPGWASPTPSPDDARDQAAPHHPEIRKPEPHDSPSGGASPAGPPPESAQPESKQPGSKQPQSAPPPAAQADAGPPSAPPPEDAPSSPAPQADDAPQPPAAAPGPAGAAPGTKTAPAAGEAPAEGPPADEAPAPFPAPPASPAPDDGTAPPAAGQPPHWSTQQPPRADWTTPGLGGPPPQGPGQGAPPPPGWGAPPPGPGAPPPPGGWAPPPGWGGPGPGYPPPGRPQPGFQPTGWGRPPAAKPGVIPLRPLSVGELLDGAVSTMRAHWRTVLGVALVVAVITQTISTLVSWWMLSGLDDDLDRLEDDPDPSFSEILDVFGGIFAGLGVTELVTLLGTLLVTAMLTMVVSRSVLGRPVTTADAWNDAKPQLLRLLGLTLLVPLIGVGVLAAAAVPGALLLLAGADVPGAVLLIIGLLGGFGVAVWLMVRLSLSSPALMLEKQGVKKAMTRSAKLVRGSWWRVFGILLLTFVITMFVASIVQTPFAFLSVMVDGDSPGSLFGGGSSGDTGLGALAVTGVGAALGMTVTFPISAGVTTLLYIDQRIRREALDLDLARAAGVTGYGAPAPAPGAHPGPVTPGS